MIVLVTGGLGFIGSNLVDFLLDKGWEVTIVDNLLSAAVSPEFFRGKCNVVVSNILDYAPKTRFDMLFHLASVVGPAGVLKHAGNLGKQMVQDTCRMIDMALEMNARLIDISTSEVYGVHGRLSEDDNKIVRSKVSVRLEYGVGKLLAEKLMKAKQ